MWFSFTHISISYCSRQRQMTTMLSKHRQDQRVCYCWKNLLCCQRDETHHFLTKVPFSKAVPPCAAGEMLSYQQYKLLVPLGIKCDFEYKSVKKINVSCYRAFEIHYLWMLNRAANWHKKLLEIAGQGSNRSKENASMCNCVISITLYVMNIGI